METLFISDIHLSEDRPDIVHIFLNFLYERASFANALYILGDLFELWIGDDNQTKLNQTIIQAFQTLTSSGLPIYIMHGNRDFLIGKQFLNATGCQLLKDPTCINLHGTPVLLTHGDLLCTQDQQYQKVRKLLRNRFLQYLFLLIPLKKRLEIGGYFRQKSQLMTRSKPKNIMDIKQSTIDDMMTRYEASVLIHGHTHHPAIHYFTLNQQHATRIVLGPWEHSGSVLSCMMNEKTSDLSFQLQSVL